MYKYLFFDLDGTLTDPYEGITKSFQYALNSFGIDEKTENLKWVIGPPLVNSFMVGYGMDKQTAFCAVEKYRERFAKIGIHENVLYDGITELLKNLKDTGKILALATSKPTVYAEQILKEFNIYDFFDVRVGSELDGRRNDKAEVIAEVLYRLGVSDKNQALMIGDRKHDILGAKRNGIDSLGVRFGYAECGELEEAGADYICDTIEALKLFLMR